MPGSFLKPEHPKEQGLTLRLPWEMWIKIRDLGREHQRPASAEIRAAISRWIDLHEHEKMVTRDYARKTGGSDGE